MNRKICLRAILPALAAGLLLAGCSGNAASSSSAASESGSSSAPGASSASSGKLVLYSAQGYDDAMAKAFQKKTGIKVKLVDDSTGNILAKMEAEKNNPHWDVAWFDGDSSMQAMDNEGMLLQNWTPGDASGFNSLGQSLVAQDKSYYPTGTTAAAAIGVNSKLLPAADYPKDWSDLLGAAYKSNVAMNDPALSGPTYPYIAGMLQLRGDGQGKQFYSSLKANGLKVFSTNDTTLQSLLKGQVKAVTIQDSALIKAKVAGNPIDIVYPASGVSTLPSVIAICKNAADMDAAKQFVAYALSPEGQAVMLNVKNGGGDSYYNPVVNGVTADQPRLDAQKNGIKWNKADPIAAAKNMNATKAWFHDNIVQ